MMTYRENFSGEGDPGSYGNLVAEGEEPPDLKESVPNLYLCVDDLVLNDALHKRLSRSWSGFEAKAIVAEIPSVIELRRYFCRHPHWIRSIFDQSFVRAMEADIFFGTPEGNHPLDLPLCSLVLAYHMMSPNQCEIRVRELLEILDFRCATLQMLWTSLFT